MLRPSHDPLIRKGRDVPRAALLEEAGVAVGLAELHAARLAGAGWTAAHTQALAALREALSAAIGDHHTQGGAARVATEREAEARAGALRFLRHLHTALPLALRGSQAGVDARSLRPAARLGQSTPKILAHLLEISAGVARLDGDLAPYFGGAQASARLREVYEALSTLDVEQELLRKRRLPQTDRVHRLAGEVLQGIEDLHRIARIAFDEDAMTRKAFTKRRIARGRRARTAGGEEKGAAE